MCTEQGTIAGCRYTDSVRCQQLDIPSKCMFLAFNNMSVNVCVSTCLNI